MEKVVSRWYTERLKQHVEVVRWGHFGRPVLLFPTAGGDAQEADRFLLIRALAPLIEAGRIKVYACDSISGRAWIDDRNSGAHRAWVQNQFDAFVTHEVVPAIYQDCRSPGIDIITAGASVGAFNAFASICRHPDIYSHAICMSGTFNLTGWMKGEHTLDFHYSSPLHFIPTLGDGPHMAKLRERFVLFALGQGRWESPHQTWQAANLLGSRGVPNYVDMWDNNWDHDWPTWRAMLPTYLDQIVP